MSTMEAATREWSVGYENVDSELLKLSLGESFEGTFIRIEQIQGEGVSFSYALLKDDSGLYWRLSGADAIRGFGHIDAGSFVRVTYTKNVDTGAPSPMKAYSILVAR